MYQGNDVVDGLIYDENQEDVDEKLKFDIYKVGTVVDDQIFDTLPNKGTVDAINFNVDQDSEQETQNFKIHTYNLEVQPYMNDI